MNSSYDYYRIFYYVAKYKNFTQAAAALLSSQPNVTRAVKNLEAELGCTLFIRSNRGVSLTPEGEKLFAHVSTAFEHIDAAERELSLDRGLQQGVISIGASEVALHCLLLPVLKKFRRQYPGIRVRVSNHCAPQAIKALNDGLIDLAVVTTPVELQKNMKKTDLKQIREVPICSGAYYEALGGRKLTLGELAEYPMVCLGKQTSTYALYSEWFAACGLALTPDIEAATADQILPMVKHDLGVGFVPSEFLVGVSENDHIYPLDLAEPVPARNICLVKRTDQVLRIAAMELEKMLLQTK